MITSLQIKQIKDLVGKSEIVEDVDLSLLTSMKVGGRAKLLVKTKESAEAKLLLPYFQKADIPFLILAGGSNVLFSENGFDGVILQYLNQDFSLQSQTEKTFVTVGSGWSTQLLANKLIDLGLSGFEYLYGLPGKIGGAIYQNSKWPRANFAIGDLVQSVRFIDVNGQEELFSQADCQFGYGSSVFQKIPGLIIEATFALQKNDPQILRQKAQETLEYRKQTQPFGVFTAGCIFKNISATEKENLHLPTTSAGYLIDKAGLKNTNQGQFFVSEIHANFIVNKGKGKTSDLFSLIENIKTRVYEQFGVKLQEEVKTF